MLWLLKRRAHIHGRFARPAWRRCGGHRRDARPQMRRTSCCWWSTLSLLCQQPQCASPAARSRRCRSVQCSPGCARTRPRCGAHALLRSRAETVHLWSCAVRHAMQGRLDAAAVPTMFWGPVVPSPTCRLAGLAPRLAFNIRPGECSVLHIPDSAAQGSSARGSRAASAGFVFRASKGPPTELARSTNANALELASTPASPEEAGSGGVPARSRATWARSLLEQARCERGGAASCMGAARSRARVERSQGARPLRTFSALPVCRHDNRSGSCLVQRTPAPTTTMPRQRLMDGPKPTRPAVITTRFRPLRLLLFAAVAVA